MKVSTILILLIFFLELNSADILSCNSALGFSMPTLCRISGGTVGANESLQISNGNSNITTLTFTDTVFTAIPAKIFVNFPNIKVFYVSSNNLNTLNSSNFENAKQLQQLGFFTNQISIIPDQAFSLCTVLTRLTITGNPITAFNGRPFSGLNKLQQLLLEDLPLQSFDSSVFQDLPELQTLTINNCSLVAIDENFLQNNIKVTNIDLTNNNISTIEIDAFSNLKLLNTLYVGNNQLTILNADYAQTIIASKNKLKSVHIGSTPVSINIAQNLISKLTCEDNMNLRYFYGSQNYLSKLACIGKMSNANLLDLKSNRIGKISKDVFANLKNVTSIEMQYNPKLKLGTKMLAPMKDLKVMKVDRFANGYKNLSQMFPKLQTLYLTTKNWNCTYLTSIANILNSQKIYLYFNNVTLDKANFKCQLNSWEVSRFNNTR